MWRIMMRVFLVSLLTLNFAIAAVDFDKPKLILSANLGPSYLLPPGSDFSNSTPTINDHREMGISLGVIGDDNSSGIWTKSRYGSGIVYRNADMKSISNFKLGNNGHFAFTVSSSQETLAIIKTSESKSKTYQFNDYINSEDFYPFANIKYLYQTLNGAFFMATNFKGHKGYFKQNNGVIQLDEQYSRRGDSKSYLFAPAYSEDGKVAYKVRYGKKNEWNERRPDKILLNINGKTSIVAQDKDSDQNSLWDGFRNSVAVNTHGHIAYVAYKNKVNSLVLNNGVETIIAQEGKDLKEITYFAPVLNDANMIAFRGIHLDGRHCIFLYENKKLKTPLCQYDEINTPFGMLMLSYGQHIPFGGNIALNNLGDLLINSGLSNIEGTRSFGKGLIFLENLAISLK